MRLAFTALLATSACSPGLSVELSGDSRLRVAIPRASEVPGGFADGWTVSFDALLVAARPGDGEPLRVYDLVRTTPSIVTTSMFDRDVAIGIAPAIDARAGNISARDLEMMNEHRYSLYARGTAVRDRFIYGFRWGFAHETSIPAGRSGRITLTPKVEHFFASETGTLRFDPFADADANQDHVLELGELRALGLEERARTLPFTRMIRPRD